MFYCFAKVSRFGNLPVEVVARDMALNFWVRSAMPATNKAALEGKLKNLSRMRHAEYPDMLVVVGRVEQGL